MILDFGLMGLTTRAAKRAQRARTILFMTAVLAFTCTGIASRDARAEGFASGEALIRTMHARYVGKWYSKLRIEQEVIHYRDGQPERREIWNELLEFPGKVRSTIGDSKDGNAEIYLHDTAYYIEDGKLARERKAVHTILLLGFDVYVQPPEKTIQTVAGDGMDLDVIREDSWKGQPVWVVGAREGDQTTPQFWIEKERLVLVRTIRKSAAGNLVDVELGGYEPLGGGWIATALVFKRNGLPYVSEKYLGYSVPDQIDPSAFSVQDFKLLP
jgi:hypothetical protein